MPKPTHGTHPDHTRTAASKKAPASQTNDTPQAVHFPQYDFRPTDAGLPTADITALLARDDGWLRVCPDTDGKVVWWKWKITRGRWAGHYVMVRGDVGRNQECIDILLHKLGRVDEGASIPTRDSYYDQA